jgi:hypothetical protein
VPANPLQRSLTLSDWHFAFCLPISRREYDASLNNSGFAAAELTHGEGYQDWKAYSAVLGVAKSILDDFADADLNLLWGPSVWEFLNLLRGPRALILLTHARRLTPIEDGALEFRGEMVPFARVVRGIRSDFTGILDICACECDGILTMVNRPAKQFAIKVNDQKLSLDIWLAYYASFLKLFHDRPTTYFDAFIRGQTFFQSPET